MEGSNLLRAWADAPALFARGLGFGATTALEKSEFVSGWCLGQLYHTNPQLHFQFGPAKPFLQPLHQISLLGLYKEKGAVAGLGWPDMQK